MVDALTHLRSDAKDNRDRILEVAREVFATDGLGVSMREVARRAEVGPATLYRRFPTKKDLVLEAFLVEFRYCRSIVEDACADSDAWRGLCTALERLSELNAQNQGFTEAFLAEYPGTVDLSTHRNDASRGLAGLAARAQRQGMLRSDFVVDDLVLLLSAGRGLSAIPLEERIRAARRFTALMIDAMRASPANQTLPPPPRVRSSYLLRT